MNKHVVIFSHGFGVDKTDRGLFTAIAAALPEGAKPIMFDYNQVDPENGNLVVAPLSDQATTLRRVYAEARAAHPDAVIDLVCHSQGCVVAGLANLDGVRRVLLLTPPNQLGNIDVWKATFGAREGTVMEREATSRLARSDGTFTLVPPSYWTDLATIKPADFYARLAEKSKVTLINAEHDEVLLQTDFTDLPAAISVEVWPTGHNFKDRRPEIARLAAGYLTCDDYSAVIVDENDAVITYKSRSEVKADDIYRVTGLWLTDSDGRVLLAQRSFNKKNGPGKWGPTVAGTVELGESYRGNIVKEIEEELGITNLALGEGPKLRVSRDHQFFIRYYVATLDKPATDFVIQPAEVEQVKWFSPTDVKHSFEYHPEQFVSSFGVPVKAFLNADNQ
jgi:isopentenyldiphosphate isomerase